MSEPATSYHARIEDSGEVLVLFRLRRADGATHGERYRRGEGWVEDARAFDVTLNGQDYEVLPADEVEAVIAELEARTDDDG